ncbi:MAG TPA: cbb3-type cytochrome c oxidase subunit 3 [Burkholderiales bacterium]|nr:cbb3-type cytochrome c oxidase subunit 3 [Burkholderiales bacterium]
MDLNDVRALWTLLSFIVFLAITVWAYSRPSKARFEVAAQSVLSDEFPVSPRQQ